MKNWRTTAFGVVIILQALSLAARAMLDGDPATQADFNAMLKEVMFGVAFLFTKDAKVTGGSVPATPEAAARLGA